jgi:putative tryptophan/tyrosine transport system substrate-binding protein
VGATCLPYHLDMGVVLPEREDHATRRRRRGLLALGAGALAWPLFGRGQQAAKVPRIGYLSAGSLNVNEAFLQALKDGLRDYGYVDGRNIAIDVRWAGDDAGDFPRLANELVSERSTAIVTTCVPSTRAAKDATRNIPIVMSIDGDPVSSGLVASLSRPGGNVTGTSTLFEELIPKWLELLNGAVPKAREAGILTNPDNLIDPFYWAQFQQAAKQLGVGVTQFEASTPEDIDRAFAQMQMRNLGGAVVMTEAFLAGHMDRIVALARRAKLPAIYGFREFAEAGGLMSYGLSFRDYYKRVARYVDAVLKGRKAGDLAVEQPTRIELVINQSTARELSIALPPQLLMRADRVIG